MTLCFTFLDFALPDLDTIAQGVKNYMVKTGHSQWKCAACGVFYNVSSNLRAHIESKHYSPGYKCPYCGLSLKTRNGMKHHIDNKHGIICSYCHIQFTNRKLYNMHFTTHECGRYVKTKKHWIRTLFSWIQMSILWLIPKNPKWDEAS